MSEEGFGGAYDPTAPEGDAGRSQYVSKKDVKIVIGGIVLLALLGVPVYKMLERNAQRSQCANNLRAISSAINQYSELHDGRYPPIMRTGPNGEPDLGETGYPYTWASDVDELMSPRATFTCPTAAPKELTTIEGHGKTIHLAYGMYEPYGGFLRNLVPNPDQTVLIAETSNLGAAGSYDPMPYKNLNGDVVPWDGFVIGWNNTNDTPTSSSAFATRLAFPGTSGGQFSEEKNSDARHDGGIHALNCSGGMMRLLKQADAKITIRAGLPADLWEAPPGRK